MRAHLVERGMGVRTAVAGAALALLVACGGLGRPGGGAAPPDDLATGPTAPGSPPGRSFQLVEACQGLEDVHPIPWLRAQEIDPQTLLVKFVSGVEECYGLDRVEVREGPRVVTVTLYEGRVPGADVCIEMAVYKAVHVQLEEPLGERDIRDGAETG